MGGKGRKFSYYNDYSTVNFGGSGRRTSGDSGRPRGARDHNWCQDCIGSGKCQHCKDGSYPRRDGSRATCGKCRGDLKCHACRGSRHGGKKCGTPTYEEALERSSPLPERETWTKYGASNDGRTKKPQTNFFMGYVGERDQRRKVHIVINHRGDIVFVRDIDGTILYDRRAGIGHLPPDLDWSR